ncbi:hypothetical protein D3C72_965820 [compost metagenome]
MQAHAARRQGGGRVLRHLRQQGRQRDALGVIQALLLFHAHEGQQLVDQLPLARILFQDAGKELAALDRRHVFLQQLGRGLDGGDRAFQFVRQGVHQLLHVFLAFQARAHRLERPPQGTDLVLSQRRQRHLAPRFHVADVMHQLAQRMVQPPGKCQADQQRQQQQDGAALQYLALAALDKRLHAGIRLGHRQHADHLIAVANRRGHMHDGRHLVIRPAARAARAILALQGEIYVIPTRIVAPYVAPAGIEQHDAVPVRDGDAVVERALAYAIDIHVHAMARVVLHALGHGRLRQRARLQVGRHQAGQQLRGIDQRVFQGRAHAGLDLLHEDIQQEPRGQPDDQEVAEQDAQANLHAPARL